jgi:wyosine [tRNA(Phe)-imidazoG37] synthetase (radical SAM superfamily)
MLKQLKGVPGVRADRFVEAGQVKHCALSLVGEPIFVSARSLIYECLIFLALSQIN